MALNGWSASAITATSVTWTKKNRSMSWQRLQSPAAITAIAGSWRNTEGLTCKVAGGLCTFDGKPPAAFAMQDQMLCLNGWVAVGITSRAVFWRKGGRKMEWKRVDSSDTAASLGGFREMLSSLSGTWAMLDGTVCTVAEGRCTFVSTGVHEFVPKDGALTINGWSLVTVTPTAAKWQNASGRAMEWQRVKDPASVPAISGLWRGAGGQPCIVADAQCRLYSEDAPIPLAVQSGSMISYNALHCTILHYDYTSIRLESNIT